MAGIDGHHAGPARSGGRPARDRARRWRPRRPAQGSARPPVAARCERGPSAGGRDRARTGRADCRPPAGRRTQHPAPARSGPARPGLVPSSRAPCRWPAIKPTPPVRGGPACHSAASKSITTRNGFRQREDPEIGGIGSDISSTKRVLSGWSPTRAVRMDVALGGSASGSGGAQFGTSRPSTNPAPMHTRIQRARRRQIKQRHCEDRHQASPVPDRHAR